MKSSQPMPQTRLPWSIAFLMILSTLVTAAGCGDDDCKATRDGAVDDAEVDGPGDVTTDAEPGVYTDATPLTALSSDQLVEVCGDFEPARDALLADPAPGIALYCAVTQFFPLNGGEPPEPPATEGECEAAQAECISDTAELPTIVGTLLGLSCEGIADVTSEFGGTGTVGDLKECLQDQLEERQRILDLECADLIAEPSLGITRSAESCGVVGLPG
jgi:hypothetical protein